MVNQSSEYYLNSFKFTRVENKVRRSCKHLLPKLHKLSLLNMVQLMNFFIFNVKIIVHFPNVVRDTP